MVIVEATGLRKSFGTQRVLDGLDLCAAEGSVLAVLGPNGAGKTTAVRVLTTLTRPDGGTARVAGYDVVREPARVRAAISLTGQSAAVDGRQTGRENLVMLARLMHLGRRAAHRRAEQLLERFELVEAAGRPVQHYSGGMRRRLDLAMSLVGQPRVVFLDEPTVGLDPASRAAMWTAIEELVAGGTTVVLTTQYLDEADRLADRIVLIDHGRVVAEGSADTLKARIGGERLDLRFADAEQLHRAAVVLRTAQPVPEPGQLRLTLATDGSAAHLHRVLEELAAGQAAPLRVSSSRPTLDDVFLQFTGHAATSPSPGAAIPDEDGAALAAGR